MIIGFSLIMLLTCVYLNSKGMRQSDYLAELNDDLKRCEGRSRGNCDSLIIGFSLIMLLTCVYLNSKGMISNEGTVICTIGLLGSFGPVTALSNLANQLQHLAILQTIFFIHLRVEIEY